MASFRAAARFDLVPGPERPGLEAVSDEDAGAEIGIETDFRRKIAGLRLMPRHERSHALRAAKEARQRALKALHERRSAHRQAKHLLRRLRALDNG